MTVQVRTVAPAGVTDSYSFPPLGFVLFQFGQPGGTNGPGNGDYKRIGYNLYSATVKYYELNYSLGTPQNGFSPLEAVGTVRENIKLSADGNSYESDFVTTFTDGAGNPAPFPNYGKTKATRIVVQPLQ